MTQCDVDIDEYWRLLTIFKEIGDAIAFTYIDKYNIKPMAFKQSAGFLSGKKGTRFERSSLRRVFAQGGVAILNDITNCLRYGDLTIAVDGMPFPLELKSGKAGGHREQRQKESLTQLHNYLLTDRVTDWYHPGEMYRQAAHSEEIHFREDLNELIHEAIGSGRAYRQVEEGLHYLIEAPGPDAEPMFDALEKIVTQFKEPGSAAFVNTFKQRNVAYLPFPLSIVNPEYLFGFYVGEYVIMMFVDNIFIKTYLGNHGLSAEFSNDEMWVLKIRNEMPSKNEMLDVSISDHFWSRIFTEFLSLRWILDEAIHTIKNPPSDNLAQPEPPDPSMVEPAHSAPASRTAGTGQVSD